MTKIKWNEVLPKIVSNPNWIQGWFVSGFFTTAWFCFAVLIPDHYFKPVAVVLVFFQTMVTYIMRAGKYVVDRNMEVPDNIITPPAIPSGAGGPMQPPPPPPPSPGGTI
jgi:hypothetical protein